MLNVERIDFIRKKLIQDGRVVSNDLARELNVSEDAIRRDLRELSKAGVCRRVYGGALLPNHELTRISARVNHANEEKEVISALAVKLLKPGDVIFLDTCTSNMMIPPLIPRDLPLTIITNSPAITLSLSDHPACKTIMIGGVFSQEKGACLGSASIAELEKILIDKLFLGACGMDLRMGLTAFDYEEAQFKRHLIENSAQVIIPLTFSKIGNVATYKVAELSVVDTVIIDKSKSGELIKDFSETNIHFEM